MADFGDCTDQLKELRDFSRKSGEILGEVDGNVLMSDTGFPLGPITPDLIRENGDVPFYLNCSPLTLAKRPQSLVLFGSNTNNGNSSPHTPKDVVFDPFAPGPDDRVLPAECRKFVDELRKSFARSLSTESSLTVKEDGNHIHGNEYLYDIMVLESVYTNVLEAIVSTHPGFAQQSKVDLEVDGYGTPILLPHLTGVAETCPAAPMKRMGKARNIDLGLCRKLKF